MTKKTLVRGMEVVGSFRDSPEHRDGGVPMEMGEGEEEDRREGGWKLDRSHRNREGEMEPEVWKGEGTARKRSPGEKTGLRHTHLKLSLQW